MPSLVLEERHALAQSLRTAGPHAPTLCGDWRTNDLAAHLILRESSLLEGARVVQLKPIERRAESALQRLAATTYADLVDRVDAGPSWREVRGPLPVAWLWALPPVRDRSNLHEYFIHHEDVRRTGEGWAPRELSTQTQAALWDGLGLTARIMLRKAPVPVELDAPGHGTRRVGRKSGRPVQVSGAPLELLLFVSGRGAHARVEFSGAAPDIEALHRADLSF